MKYLIRVQANHECYIADIYGDPGRTTIREKARVYSTKRLADNQIAKLKKDYPNREFYIEPLNEKG